MIRDQQIFKRFCTKSTTTCVEGVYSTLNNGQQSTVVVMVPRIAYVFTFDVPPGLDMQYQHTTRSMLFVECTDRLPAIEIQLRSN